MYVEHVSVYSYICRNVILQTTIVKKKLYNLEIYLVFSAVKFVLDSPFFKSFQRKQTEIWNKLIGQETNDTITPTASTSNHIWSSK